ARRERQEQAEELGALQEIRAKLARKDETISELRTQLRLCERQSRQTLRLQQCFSGDEAALRSALAAWRVLVCQSFLGVARQQHADKLAGSESLQRQRLGKLEAELRTHHADKLSGLESLQSRRFRELQAELEATRLRLEQAVSEVGQLQRRAEVEAARAKSALAATRAVGGSAGAAALSASKTRELKAAAFAAWAQEFERCTNHRGWQEKLRAAEAEVERRHCQALEEQQQQQQRQQQEQRQQQQEQLQQQQQQQQEQQQLQEQQQQEQQQQKQQLQKRQQQQQQQEHEQTIEKLRAELDEELQAAEERYLRLEREHVLRFQRHDEERDLRLQSAESERCRIERDWELRLQRLQEEGEARLRAAAEDGKKNERKSELKLQRHEEEAETRLRSAAEEGELRQKHLEEEWNVRLKGMVEDRRKLEHELDLRLQRHQEEADSRLESLEEEHQTATQAWALQRMRMHEEHSTEKHALGLQLIRLQDEHFRHSEQEKEERRQEKSHWDLQLARLHAELLSREEKQEQQRRSAEASRAHASRLLAAARSRALLSLAFSALSQERHCLQLERVWAVQLCAAKAQRDNARLLLEQASSKGLKAAIFGSWQHDTSEQRQEREWSLKVRHLQEDWECRRVGFEQHLGVQLRRATEQRHAQLNLAALARDACDAQGVCAALLSAWRQSLQQDKLERSRLQQSELQQRHLDEQRDWHQKLQATSRALASRTEAAGNLALFGNSHACQMEVLSAWRLACKVARVRALGRRTSAERTARLLVGGGSRGLGLVELPALCQVLAAWLLVAVSLRWARSVELAAGELEKMRWEARGDLHSWVHRTASTAAKGHGRAALARAFADWRRGLAEGRWQGHLTQSSQVVAQLRAREERLALHFAEALGSRQLAAALLAAWLSC
ncbi:unnamed protein product, partial [Polarella glacialis]